MDNNRVIKVKTAASGPFVFSWLFSEEVINPLLTKIDILYNTVRDLPILPSVYAQLEEDLIRRSIFGTAAIEGNPLDEKRVGEILSEPDIEKSRERAEQEIINLKKTYDIIKNIDNAKYELNLEEKNIKAIHYDITSGIEYGNNLPGLYRDFKVKVGNSEHGGVYTPPKCEKDVNLLMSKFIEFMKSKNIIDLHPVLRAAIAHFHFSKIHPFGDGNGRTARIIEASLLKSAGIKYVPQMLSNYYYRNMDDYYWAFSLSIKNKEHAVTPFVEFVAKGIIESLEEIKEFIIYYIRIVTLREHFQSLKRNKKLTQRQFDILDILLNYLDSFTIEDLLTLSPFEIVYRGISKRTASRDIKKLLGLKLIEEKESGKYCFNYRALG